MTMRALRPSPHYGPRPQQPWEVVVHYNYISDDSLSSGSLSTDDMAAAMAACRQLCDTLDAASALAARELRRLEDQARDLRTRGRMLQAVVEAGNAVPEFTLHINSLRPHRPRSSGSNGGDGSNNSDGHGGGNGGGNSGNNGNGGHNGNNGNSGRGSASQGGHGSDADGNHSGHAGNGDGPAGSYTGGARSAANDAAACDQEDDCGSEVSFECLPCSLGRFAGTATPPPPETAIAVAPMIVPADTQLMTSSSPSMPMASLAVPTPTTTSSDVATATVAIFDAQMVALAAVAAAALPSAQPPADLEASSAAGHHPMLPEPVRTVMAVGD